MSGIYFTSRSAPDEVLRIRGPERAAAGLLTDAIALSVLRIHDRDRPLPDWIVELLADPDKEHYRGPYGAPALRANYSEKFFVLPDGTRHNIFETFVNTVSVTGSPVVSFLARMHASCEAHGFIAGEDRAWLADLVTEGRRLKILRDGMEWEELIRVARMRDDEPLVMSHSSGGSFPELECTEKLADPSDGAWWWEHSLPESYIEPEERGKIVLDTFDPEDHHGRRKYLWDRLTDDARWRLAIEGIKTQPALRISPENISKPVFGSGLTCHDLVAIRDKWQEEENKRIDAERAAGEAAKA